jgi:amidase
VFFVGQHYEDMLPTALPPAAAVGYAAAGAVAVIVVVPLVKKVARAAALAVRRVAAAPRQRAIAARKRAELAKAVEAAKAFILEQPPTAARVAELTALGAAALIAQQVAGDVTAVTLLRAFLTNAVKAHAATNCLVAIDLTNAIAAAEAADAHLAATRAVLGPLHGLPVSIKDCCGMADTDATIGLFCLAEQPAVADSAVVALVRKAGGVPFVKTNVPQTMYSYECNNALFGATTSPYGKAFTPGGSSGGEAALLAQRGSVVGVGSDIGGSLRIPAHFCGVVGFKPTSGRVPLLGMRSAVPQEGVLGTPGPMGNCVDDVARLMAVLTTGVSAVDGNAYKMDFDAAEYAAVKAKGSKLTFGYYLDDGFLAASPPCRRAVREAVAALRADGHDVVLYAPPELRAALMLFYQLLCADFGVSLVDFLGAEPYHAFVAAAMTTANLPAKHAVAALVALKDPALAAVLSATAGTTVPGYFQLLKQKNALRQAFAMGFHDAGIDAVIAPGLATPAAELGSTTHVSFGCAYTAEYNLLDGAAVCVPVTTVDPAVDGWRDEPTAAPLVAARVRGMFDAAKGAGLPVGVQVVCPRNHDEQALACAAVLEASLARSRQ